MIKSHIIEAASFSQSRVEFNVPAALCANMKIADIGVYGVGATYPLDPILGQLGIIKSITLRDNAQVLSQYDRRLASLLEYKTLMKTNTRHRSLVRRLYAHNYGLQLENGGANNTVSNNIGNQGLCEGAVYPRICVDKRSLSRIAVNQVDTKLAILDVRDCLGWANASYEGNPELSAYMPCHLHQNMKLQIEFNPVASVAANATVAQPYLIFDEILDPQLIKAYGNAMASWTDLELEEVYLGAATSTKKFLNSFYGKTVGNLHIIPLNNGAGAVPLAPSNGATAGANDRVNLLVNQVPLLQLSGIDSPGKRNMYLQMAAGDVAIPLLADRVIRNCPDKTNSNDAVNSLYEGAAAAGTPGDITNTNYYSSGSLSYTALPVQSKITSLQLDFSRSNNYDGTLLCFGEVLKMSSMSGSTPIVSYA